MANNLAVGIVIGAVLKGSVKAAFGTAQKTSDALGKSIVKTTTLQQKLLAKFNVGPQQGLTKLRGQYEQINKQIEKAVTSQKRLDRAIASQSAGKENRAALRGQMRETAGHAVALGAPIWGSVKAFMAQEEAATRLRIAMMRADGTVGAFTALSKEVIELGKILPGTASDFFDLATALKEQGVSDARLTGGALRQAAGLNIVMDMDQRSGGVFFAKMLEAHGLEEKDFGKAADLTQRAKFAYGMEKDDMYASMKYYAPNTRALGLTGVDNYEKLLAIQGMGAQVGLEGSSFGTNFSQMLTRMSKGPKALENSNRGMKAEAREIMQKSNVKFEFYDDKGKFKGLEGMVSEMEKLKKIKAEQGEQAALDVGDAVFGAEAGRPALIIAEKGREGLEANLKLMREQADLQMRIKEKTSTLSAALEQFGGVAEHAFGTFGSVFAPDIKEFSGVAQDFIENTLQPWLVANKPIILTTVKIVAGLIAFKLATLGLMYSFSMIASPFKMLWVNYSRLRALGSMVQLWRVGGGAAKLGGQLRRLGSGFVSVGKHAFKLGRFLGGGLIKGLSMVGKFSLSLARILGGGLIKGLMLAGKAVLFIGRALLMNPIGLIITGIAIAAFLIWKYWEPIKGFFSRLWTRVVKIFDKVWLTIQVAMAGGIGGVSKLILNWSPIALFYRCFAKVMSYFGVDLPAKFTDFGGMIVNGLINGVKAKWEEAKALFGEFGAMVGNAFKKPNEIKSPSRLFMGFGGYIVDGLAIGLSKNAPKAEAEMQSLSDRLGLDPKNQLDGSVGVGGMFGMAPNPQGAANVTINFAPVIQGGGDPVQMGKQLSLSYQEFVAMMKQYNFDQVRRSF